MDEILPYLFHNSALLYVRFFLPNAKEKNVIVSLFQMSLASQSRNDCSICVSPARPLYSIYYVTMIMICKLVKVCIVCGKYFNELLFDELSVSDFSQL